MDDRKPNADPGRTLANRPGEAEQELIRLRERLSFYESFDQVIQDNVSRAGGLLREAANIREEAQVTLVNAEAKATALRGRDRAQHRTLFSSVLDQVSTLQGQLERLAREVGDALDDLEADLPLGTSSGALESGIVGHLPASTPSTANLGEAMTAEMPSPSSHEAHQSAPAVTAEDLEARTDLPVEEAPEPQPVGYEIDDLVETGALEEQEEPVAAAPSAGLGDAEIALDLDDIAAEPGFDQPYGGANADSSFLPDIDLAGEAPDDFTGDDIAPAIEPASTTVVAHNIPRATLALSLKRYIESLPHVVGVEPREFAEGMLRMQVASEGPITFEHVRSWPESPGLSPKDVHDGWVEFELVR